jgi:hypothetical protein
MVLELATATRDGLADPVARIAPLVVRPSAPG